MEAQQRSPVKGATPRRHYERPVLRPLDRNRWRILSITTVAVDFVSVAAALVMASFVRFGSHFSESRAYSWGLLIWMPLWIVGLLFAGAYDRHRTENPAEELRHVIQGVVFGAAIVVTTAFSFGFHLSRAWASLAALSVLVWVAALRRAMRKIIHALRRRGKLHRRVLIVGADASGRAIADEAERSSWEGLDVVGFVSVDGASRAGLRDGDVVVGPVQHLRELVVAFRASEVLVAPSVGGHGSVGLVIAALDGVPVDLRIAPGLEGFLPSRVAVHPLGDRPLLAIERVELQPSARFIKRILDLVAGIIITIVLSPVLLACAVAVRLNSKGPVLFAQTRVGLNGREFTVWKFRSMVADAEEQRRLLAQRNEAEGLLFKMRNDPRVTRVGRVLRRTSLDELPQLFNVLRGNMSLVGPRPPLPDEVARYDEKIGRRLLVKPGMTGLWQVSGRHQLSFEDYIRYDILYVQNWSLALDLYILAKTIPAVIMAKGAY